MLAAVRPTAPQTCSFNPFKNEPFKLDNPIDFVDAQGNVGFTLKQLDVTFN